MSDRLLPAIVFEGIESLLKRLYPICRSITGNGVRETLRILQEHIPLEMHEIPSGTQVFDWTVPKEWNIRDAYVKNMRGERVIDFTKSNLHVVGYSVPFKGSLPLSELKSHLFSLPAYPDWVPYRTSYYKESWGFCLSHRQLIALPEGEYDVLIDSSLADGHLTYGEYFLEGEKCDEVLLSTHVCHPSLGNDNLAGLVILTLLFKYLSALPRRRYSYRFLFIPGTIGSIAWLCRNESRVERIRHGLVLACAGDAGKVTYKESRQAVAEIDRAVRKVLIDSGAEHEVVGFSPYGYDERQFCSPGFNLAVGCMMRTPHGTFPEYHTSADNLDFVKIASVIDSFEKCAAVCRLLEGNRSFVNLNPKCEPQLGKRGLYRSIGGTAESQISELAMLWILNYSDGKHDLLDIAERSKLPFDLIKKTADVLITHRLLVGGVENPKG